MNLTKKTFNSAIWESLSLVTIGVTQIVFLAVLARYLSPEEFGMMAIINITINLLNMLSELGLGVSLVQRKEINTLHLRGVFSTTMLISILFVIALYYAAPSIAAYFKTQDAVILIRCAILTFPLLSFGSVSRSMLHKKMKFKKMFWINFFSHVCGYAPSGIIAAIFGLGAWSIIVSFLAYNIIYSTLSFIYEPHSIMPAFPRKELSELLKFGTGISLSRISLYFSNQGDYFVIGRTMGVTALGLYEPIFRIMAMPGQYLGNLLDRILFPVMAKIQDETNRLENIYLKGLKIVNTILLPFSLICILLSREIVLLVLGSNWIPAIIPLQILFIGITFRTSVRISDSLLRAIGAVYNTAAIKAIYAISLIFGCWIGHFWGLTGVAVAVVTASLINYILSIRLALTLLNAKYSNVLTVMKTGLILSIVAFFINSPLIFFSRMLFHMPLLTLTIFCLYNLLLAIILAIFFPRIINVFLDWISDMFPSVITTDSFVNKFHILVKTKLGV